LKGDENVEAFVRFDTRRFIPYVDGAELMCWRYPGENKKEEGCEEGGVCAWDRETLEAFGCAGDDDGGRLLIRRKKNGWYFLLGGARMSVTTDDPFVHEVRAKSDRFLRGEEVPCFREKDAIFAVRNVSGDPRIDQLMATLSKTWSDIIVNDIDYSGERAVAVGLDNSVETRIKQRQDEYLPGVILYSHDGGVHWEKLFFEAHPFDRVLLDGDWAFALGTLEGDGGYIYRSADGGAHWKTVFEGGFLNTIVKHRGHYLAGGYALLRSDRDGVTWRKEPMKLQENEITALFSVDAKRLLLFNGEKLYLNRDGGVLWEPCRLPEGLYGLPMRVAIYRKGKRIYLEDAYQKGFSLFSDDDGRSWKTPEEEKERSE